jgi:8-oxo-dGTP diphosphatase
MDSPQKNPRVGIGVMVIKDGKVLVGRRKGSHAAGLLSFPGGHLDWNETWEECLFRELREECGPNFKVRVRTFPVQNAVFVTNDVMKNYDKHYITIFMVADWVAGEPVNAEPHKCEGWNWVSYDQLAELYDAGDFADWMPLEKITAMRRQIGL